MKNLLWKLFNWLNKYIAAPRIIVGYKNSDGILLTKTRVSNTVNIVSPNKLTLEDNVYIGHYSVIEASNGIIIDEGCQICTHVLITSHSSHRAIRLYGKHYIGQKSHIGYVVGQIRIGKYSFVGAHATIMPGTKIGKGSLITAYSFVQGEFPDYAIIAGNPATVVGDTRTSDQEYLNQHPEIKQYYTEWTEE